MVRKTGLGKGMAALLPVVEEEGKRYFSCPIEEIRPNRNQPRKTFTPDRLEELAASIREKGIIQPLVVRKKGDHYELIAGERRWRAAQKAGLREVPVVIQDVSEDTALEMALIENIQREDLNAVEEAEAYHALMENFSLTQDELAKRVGKDRSTVANSLRLLKLPAELKKDIVEERLAMGHARAILALDTDLQMREARDAVVKGNLTVREAESLVKRLKGEQKPKPKVATVEVHAADLVEQLRRRFMTKIAVRKSGKGGKIEIAYGSRDELARIVDLLLG
ncbi:parB-like partition protein [Geobacter metallireducens RCH3]|uniref:ParB-like nuclease domain protein, putative transcriptional regulator n=1 Tax=Geobacter metallireducens (strain ATCC 53774 / DSM 7210 / GS-15) TaxID=269799 RepID=Q39Q50_GEOMG|nr:ParB/RepB/Spo0J family partition protein [Geobacter metallireducens]ABB33624.1 ParB-like nuclease domain protein, putative transcriptional regulator [Geobacter metallireducens GS-15]EHP84844.1 parB-like partition protein [Geobacter metallireducens RCH3]